MEFGFRFVIVYVPIILLLFYSSRSKRSFSSLLFLIISVLIIGGFLFDIGKYIYTNSRQPPEWDFLVFWLDGKVATAGDNFYRPENYQKITLPYEPSDEFRGEIIDVGFKYPPFTMLLLFPLGFFDFSTAYVLWQVLSCLIGVACIYGLWKLILPDSGWVGALFVSAFFLLLRPIFSTLFYAQTNFLVLLFFLFFWRWRSDTWGGIWLAFCVVVKPYMLVLYLYPFLARKWKTLAIAILTLLILTLVSVIAFGPDVFMSFVKDPASKVPAYLYTETVNQSLLATILRQGLFQSAERSPLLNPLYLGVSLLLTSLTAWITLKPKPERDDWKLLAIVFLALMIYPAALQHYGVFLIMPILLLLQRAPEDKIGAAVVFFIILAVYFFSGYQSGGYAFFANALMWFTCLAIAAELDLQVLKRPILKAQ